MGKYLDCVRGEALSRLLFKFHLDTNRLFEELGRHASSGGSQECPNCGACKESTERVLFECASYDSQGKFIRKNNIYIVWLQYTTMSKD